MAEINHRVGIAGSAEEIYSALTTDAGLAGWWTTDTSGAGEVGSLIRFRFDGGGPDFEVAELQAGRLVRWKHSGEMPDAWRASRPLSVLRMPTGRRRLISWRTAVPSGPCSC